MIRLFLVFMCVLPFAADASPVLVKSGEHDGFTRLVMDFGTPVQWTVGRAIDGYALHLSSGSAVFDLTDAFNLIGKGRLAALWTDPATGDLRVGIACACHAIPFEFRPGIVVIDLKDGPPPKGSSFELSLDGSTVTSLSARDTAIPRPRPRPKTDVATYEWMHSGTRSAENTTDSALSDPAMEPLRASLLWQMSKGAAEGVLDMTVPAKTIPVTVPSSAFAADMRIGEDRISNLSAMPVNLAAQGQLCIDNDVLDISSWGSDRPIAEQLAGRMSGLIGEFDHPDPAVIEKAVQLNLFLGFGAEARQLLSIFPVADQRGAIWISLAHLLDDERDDSQVFAGLAACDGAAALWALLSDGDDATEHLVNSPAVLLAFSRLPVHLRKQLAPRLADHFLARHDEKSARAVRDAVLRAPGQQGGAMAVIGAKLDLYGRDAPSAEVALAPLLTDPSSATPEVLVAYVEARIVQNLRVKPEIVPALASLVREMQQGKGRDRILRALILAQAASGDFNAAFSGLSANSASVPDLWRLLASQGADADILAHGIFSDKISKSAVDDATAEAIAGRLIDLGFAQVAALWLTNVDNPNPTLAARVALRRGDARGALRSLAGISAPDAELLRREALRYLGDDAALAEIYAGEGDDAARSAALGRAGDWQTVATLTDGPWQALAKTLTPPSNLAASGPLAAARQLTEASAQTQIAVTDLLQTVPMPIQP